jgi:hypothetical protein
VGTARAYVTLARAGKHLGEAILVRMLRRLTVPASESHLAIALVLSVVTMSLMLYAILWQSGVIETQRDLIRMIWASH